MNQELSTEDTDADTWPAPRVIHPNAIHTQTIILLHDQGSTGVDFAAEFCKATTSSGKQNEI